MMAGINLHCFLIFLATVFKYTQGQPQIVSSPDTVGVFAGQTAILKCQVANLGHHMLTWTFLKHDIVIYEGGHILASNKSKYAVINTASGHIQNLQILNVEKSDQGFYKCAIDDTNEQIITHLDVMDVPNIILPTGPPLNVTDCCIAEKVTDSCLPSCYPSAINLDHFNATENCGSIQNIKGLSKCFTGGSNHDNCCLYKEVDPVCLDFCHNNIQDTLSTEQISKCFTEKVINRMFACFEIGFGNNWTPLFIIHLFPLLSSGPKFLTSAPL